MQGSFNLALVLLVAPLFAAAQDTPERAGAMRPPIDPLPELTDEEMRRARLREAGRQAEVLRNQLEELEQQRLRRAYSQPSTAAEAPPAPAAEPKVEAAVPAAAKEEPAGRCDGFSRDMEAVIREEMRGGDRATMGELTARRQQIYLARLRAGC